MKLCNVYRFIKRWKGRQQQTTTRPWGACARVRAHSQSASRLAAVTFTWRVLSSANRPVDGIKCARARFGLSTSHAGRENLNPPGHHEISLPLILNMSHVIHSYVCRGVATIHNNGNNTGVSSSNESPRYGAIKCVSRFAEDQVCRRSRGR